GGRFGVGAGGGQRGAGPAVRSARPPRSIGVGSLARDSGTHALARVRAARPTGKLTRNTVRQPSPAMLACISTPPISWPLAPASPITNAYTPTARALSAPPYRTPTRDRTLGLMSAAAVP